MRFQVLGIFEYKLESNHFNQVSRENGPVVIGARPTPQHRAWQSQSYWWHQHNTPHDSPLTLLTQTKGKEQIFLQNGSDHPVQCQKTILKSHRFNTLETGPSSKTTK